MILNKNEIELFSVVISTYMREPSILKVAIDSVLNQTYKNIELFIINDAPDNPENDKILKLINSYNDNRMHYLINYNEHGANYVRNMGLKLSKGKYISFLDDDDYWDLNRIDIFSKELNDSIILIYSDMVMFTPNRKKLSKRYLPKKNEILKTILYDNFIGGFSNATINRSFLLSKGGLNNDMQSYQDQELWTRLLIGSEIKYINIPLTFYRLSESSISNNNRNKLNGLIKFIEINNKLFTKYPSSKTLKLKNEYILSLKNDWVENSQIIYDLLKNDSPRLSILKWKTIGILKRYIQKILRKLN